MRRALLFAALLGACAEMRTPPPAGAGLGDGNADPVRGAILAMAPAFADRAKALQGKPAETAEAAARLEYVVTSIELDGRYGVLSPGLRRELILAQQEVRTALGIAPDLAGREASRALGAAARALRAQQPAAAAAALPAPGFRPGGAGSLERLADVGPLPQAAIATGQAAEEVERLDAARGWSPSPTPEVRNLGPGTLGLNDQPSDAY